MNFFLFLRIKFPKNMFSKIAESGQLWVILKSKTQEGIPLGLDVNALSNKYQLF